MALITTDLEYQWFVDPKNVEFSSAFTVLTPSCFWLYVFYLYVEGNLFKG